jgi:hypothetical protein
VHKKFAPVFGNSWSGQRRLGSREVFGLSDLRGGPAQTVEHIDREAIHELEVVLGDVLLQLHQTAIDSGYFLEIDESMFVPASLQ